MLLFFVANRLFFFSPTALETISSYITYPLLVIQNSIIDPFKKRIERKATIEELSKQVAELQTNQEALVAENVQLQSTLSFIQNSEEVSDYKNRYEMSKGRLVHIIHKHIADDANYIFIDAGANQGIEEDMVAVYKNCLLGRVSKVYPCYSKIILTSDKNCKVATVCVTTNVHGIHVGCNQLYRTELSHVSHLLTLQQGDLVISSGEGLVFPQGFGLGMVESFEPVGLNYVVTVKPLLNVHCIEYCYVLKKNNG